MKSQSLLVVVLAVLVGLGVIIALGSFGLIAWLVPMTSTTVTSTPGSFDSGEGCAKGPEGTIPLINQDHGYCVRYLEGFTESYPTFAITKLVGQTPAQESNHAELHIEMTPSEDRTADMVADELLAEYASSVPGSNVVRSAITLGDEAAVLLESVPGQDMSRKVIAVYGERLFILTFLPWNKDSSIVSQQLVELYSMVVETWEFH